MAFELLDGPRIERRDGAPTLGIRVVTPFRGMLGVRDSLLRELADWLEEHEVEPDGPCFLRLHTVDMARDMDIEVGVVSGADAASDRVHRGSMPGGEYGILAYRGGSLQANRLLLHDIPDRGRRFDADLATGRWAGRFELLRTDSRSEPRKTAWTIELAFLLAPE
ncbi:hypothetical protein [Microbacterium sp. 179-I 3D4 NHS]|uniref:hypothetical protein n=1 Tax=Microbacterium sp. 179-I 3D4 NHS TaxID=3142381 RepID=UPI0039A188B6